MMEGNKKGNQLDSTLKGNSGDKMSKDKKVRNFIFKGFRKFVRTLNWVNPFFRKT